jgi:orotidine-5'-phosphate decarboxylase
MKISSKERLIVALDVDDISRAIKLVDELKEYCSIFKVGTYLFTRAGREIIDIIHNKGCRVFLDLKYHDIPTVVAGAVKAAVELGVFMCTLHISGGLKMLKAAVSAKSNSPIPKLIGITVLTSMDQQVLEEIGIMKTVGMQVSLLVNLARKAGIDGVVVSSHEIFRIREICGEDFILVVPGIRTEIVQDDQKRIATPIEAIRSGATFIVVGRPIIHAEVPAKVAEQIIKEIELTGK